MTQNFWNTVKPVSVNFNINHGSAYSQPPVNNPLPNNILPPGARPSLPPAKVPPGPSGNLKQAINHLPSIFTLTLNNGPNQ